MPIAALPQNSVRALGSSQVLTDSASLVKELIDNAIDGRATTISVDISLNTLDDIRVKDNGHGIAPLDRSLACTMHCTSKIRDLVDLRDIGGRSLGFRGVALASAAEMSRCLTISTRIEGEATASELTFGRQGQIARYLEIRIWLCRAHPSLVKSVHLFR
jgi:DNA mismatch repair ATPase MutL